MILRCWQINLWRVWNCLAALVAVLIFDIILFSTFTRAYSCRSSGEESDFSLLNEIIGYICNLGFSGASFLAKFSDDGLSRLYMHH